LSTRREMCREAEKNTELSIVLPRVPGKQFGFIFTQERPVRHLHQLQPFKLTEAKYTGHQTRKAAAGAEKDKDKET